MDHPVDGFIYGQPPPPADDRVPDIEGMFEATGIPQTEPGGLPHSVEWYAGAKDRQKARDQETDELLVRKNNLRYDWAMLACDELISVHDRVAAVAAEPEPLDLALLLARAAHERPKDRAEAELLLHMDQQVQADRDRLQKELAQIMERLKSNESHIREREAVDQAAEDERIERVKQERRKKAKNDRALARNAARLRGEEVPDTDEEEAVFAAAEAAEDAAEEAAKQAAKEAAKEAADAKAESQPKPGTRENRLSPSVSPSRSPSKQPDVMVACSPSPSRSPSKRKPSRKPSRTAPPPGSRGGLGTQLPPLSDPPAPPAVGKNQP